MVRCYNCYCETTACYNYEGKRKPKYCAKHKLKGMVDVKSSRCIHPTCKKQSVYNIPNEKARYCSEHKTNDMINVKRVSNPKICIHTDCKNESIYNVPNKTSKYCSQHKTDNMIIIKQKTCIYQDCKKIPCFNMKNKIDGLYCFSHKLDGMVNIVSKTCEFKNCIKKPLYNKKGEQPKYCNDHKLDDMINVRHKKCLHSLCNTIAYFNIEGGKPMYCSIHKINGMVDVIHKRCKTPLCNTNVTKKYDGHCLYCYVHLFPFSPLTRNYKTKEASVVEFVKNSFPNYSWITDKRIQDGCSKRRPDIFLDLGDQVLIVEVDENQHVNYDCSCENKRLMELSQDVGHRPIVFIRLNPDDYIEQDKNVPSCWGTNQYGICIIKKKKEWDLRLEALKQQIEYWIKERTIKMVEVIQLFY